MTQPLDLPAGRREPPPAEAVALLLAEATDRYKAGDLEQAELLAQRALEREPRQADALNIIGIVSAIRGDAARAADLLGEAVRLHPAPGPIRGNLALALRMLGRFQEAVAHATEAVRWQPENRVSWDTLSAAHHELGNHAEARTASRVALCLDPLSAEAWSNLASTLLELGRTIEAERAFRTALYLNADLADAWTGLGSLHMRQRRYEAAHDALRRALAMRRGSRWWPRPAERAAAALPTLVNTIKLRHDIEQIEHLRRKAVLGPEFDPILAGYRAARRRFEAKHGLTANGRLDAEDLSQIGDAYGRIVNWDPPAMAAGPALAPDWDRAEVAGRHVVEPGITWIDGFLTEPTLAALCRFCLEATIWNDIGHNFQADPVPRGYLGAYVGDGLLAPLLFQIADELTRTLPTIFGDQRLHQMWGYKYEETLEGIAIHGDGAAINVNFWITPDAANLDPKTGGLLIYPVKAPKHMDFGTINHDPAAINRFLDESGAEPVNIPYRQNRCVIFNSDLFHATAPLRFKSGYENRRINLTMLFGSRR